MNYALQKLVFITLLSTFLACAPLDEAKQTCGKLDDAEFTFWDGFTRIPFKIRTGLDKTYIGNIQKDKLWWQFINASPILESSKFAHLRDLVKVTIQKVPIDDYLPNIFKASKALSDVQGGLQFLGCATDEKNVFLVYETISSNIKTNDFVAYYNGLDFPRRLAIFTNLIQQLAALEKEGLIHDTLKPGDILYGKFDQGFLISDFDHLSEKGKPLKGAKRPGASPGHYSNPPANAAFIDALYPFVLAIMDEILADWSTYMIDTVRSPEMKSCWEKLSKECREKIKNTVLEELKKGPIGEPILKTGEGYRETNVAGLISAVLTYDDFPFTPEQVIEIMGRDAAPYESIKPIAPVDEAKAVKASQANNDANTQKLGIQATKSFLVRV